MSDKLGWGTDGRLFQEKVLQGGRLVIDKVLTTTAGGCKGDVLACTEPDGSKITFSVTGLTGKNEDQWAYSQFLAIHELGHVWDFRLGQGGDSAPLTNGLLRVLAATPAQARNRGFRGREGIEDFADSVASFVMGGTRSQTDVSYYGSARENYIACIATVPNHAEGNCAP